MYVDDEHTYFKLYRFEGTPFLLPRFVTNYIFTSEVCQQYLYWCSFFEQKKKHQFMQTPFSVAKIRVNNIFHLKEVAREFDIFEFVKGPTIHGFDPEGNFVAHLNFVGYTNLSKIFVPQEVEENRSPKTLISTNVRKMK